jgi:hypothetical protein
MAVCWLYHTFRFDIPSIVPDVEVVCMREGHVVQTRRVTLGAEQMSRTIKRKRIIRRQRR